MNLGEWLIFIGVCSSASLPGWLTQLTGLSTWPEMGKAPYIAEKHHYMRNIPDIAPRDFAKCDSVSRNDFVCSFDCHNCYVEEDVFTCDPISQTFDDGPTPATPELLNYLKKLRTKTTFFLVGRNVVEFPEIVKREKREGHLLAVHTWSHKFLPALSNEEVFAELQWTIWAINVTAGVVPKYFRPPYGGLDNRIRAIAKQLGLVIVVWDRDTTDWQLNDGTAEVSNLVSKFENWLDASTRLQSTPPKRKWYMLRTPKAVAPSGLLLEHDLSENNVELAKRIGKKLSHKQKTVAQCAGMKQYQ